MQDMIKKKYIYFFHFKIKEKKYGSEAIVKGPFSKEKQKKFFFFFSLIYLGSGEQSGPKVASWIRFCLIYHVHRMRNPNQFNTTCTYSIFFFFFFVFQFFFFFFNPLISWFCTWHVKFVNNMHKNGRHRDRFQAQITILSTFLSNQNTSAL